MTAAVTRSGATVSAALRGPVAVARYQRFDGARDDAAGADRTASRVQAGATPSSSARLLSALIERMGGASGSRPKGSYINLRV